MELKGILIKKYGEEEEVEPKGETFTMQELGELIGAKAVDFISSKIPDCVMIADRFAKEKDNWFLNVNTKASELARSSIGEATIVGDVIICNRKFLNEGLPQKNAPSKHGGETRIKNNKFSNDDDEPQVDFNPPPPPR